ncbi:MAG: ferredoxin-NADP reductase [Hadesarchaea archaeon YNP_N21]|jgi:ferredoxin--NADP+ reductase|nr:MAG: ferredoxin-NADP reductase [Hadesarchaea archaeon YNP_N21]
MYEIVEKKVLAPEIKLYKVNAPLVARKARPGQFVILRVGERGERIPLTIVDFDRGKGTITIIFQEVGKTTKQLGLLGQGDCILNLVGPLGIPLEERFFGTVACAGGGVGTAEVYPLARALKNAGNFVISIIGARSKELLVLEHEMRGVSDELYITTDDGSKGIRGFVTEPLRAMLDGGRKIDLVIAVGPVPMMKAVSDLTREKGIKTLVSLNPLMLDGMGMCGVCRVTVGGRTRFTCVEGPMFDGHEVDFDELKARLQTYFEQERLSLQKFHGLVK